MITDEIMEIIWDMQEEIRNQIKEIEHKFKSGNMIPQDYNLEHYVLKQKLTLLYEVEYKLGNFCDDSLCN